MAWCFSTRASVTTVLTMHPCVSRCLRVKMITILKLNFLPRLCLDLSLCRAGPLWARAGTVGQWRCDITEDVALLGYGHKGGKRNRYQLWAMGRQTEVSGVSYGPWADRQRCVVLAMGKWSEKVVWATGKQILCVADIQNKLFIWKNGVYFYKIYKTVMIFNDDLLIIIGAINPPK